MIRKITTRIRTAGGGLVHDSRADIRTLTKVINEQTDKINELITYVNELEDQVNNRRTRNGGQL